MRLIDADALDSVVFKLNTEEHAQITRLEYKRIDRVIFEFPTIDAVPVRHGKWIDDGQYADYHPHHEWRCSECGEQVIEVDTSWYKYCPNCGARMENENETY